MNEIAESTTVLPMNHIPMSYGDHAARCDRAIASAYRGMTMAAVALYLARKDLEAEGTWDQFVMERARQHDADERTLRRYVENVSRAVEEGWYNPQLTISAIINLSNSKLTVDDRKRLALDHCSKNGTTLLLKDGIKKALAPKSEVIDVNGEEKPLNEIAPTGTEMAGKKIDRLETELNDIKALLREGVGLIETLGGGDPDAAEFVERANAKLAVE